MKGSVFTGAGVALITPFNENGVDYQKLDELIEFQIAGGIDSIIITGTTGEASVMPDDEQIVVSTNQGEPLVGDDSLAGKAYMNICRRVIGEEVPMLDLNVSEGFFAKLGKLFKKN